MVIIGVFTDISNCVTYDFGIKDEKYQRRVECNFNAKLRVGWRGGEGNIESQLVVEMYSVLCNGQQSTSTEYQIGR